MGVAWVNCCHIKADWLTLAFYQSNMSNIDPLVRISRHYGSDPDYVIAGGGNTSFKTQEELYIKASGISLATIDASGFVKLSRRKLALIEEKDYPENAAEREEAVKTDLGKAVLSPANLRPSVETSLHNLIGYNYVVHTHPTLVNAVMCARNAQKETEAMFGSGALYIPYTDPGYILFREVMHRIRSYEKKYHHAPGIIFLQNHGIFVSADSVQDINDIYDQVMTRIAGNRDIGIPDPGKEVAPASAISGFVADFAGAHQRVFTARKGPLTDYFTASRERFGMVSRPFTPDIIVYCKSRYLFLEKGLDRTQTEKEISAFAEVNGYFPRVILEEQGPLMVTEDNEKSLATVMEVFLDMLKIAYLTEQFGGPHPMSDEQIAFIDQWEVENYRRKIART